MLEYSVPALHLRLLHIIAFLSELRFGIIHIRQGFRRKLLVLRK
jgi:hypothetical protein